MQSDDVRLRTCRLSGTFQKQVFVLESEAHFVELDY